MKKTYQQPCTDDGQVELLQMIAASVTPQNLGEHGGNEIGDDTDASRKNYNVWDAEEDAFLEEEY